MRGMMQKKKLHSLEHLTTAITHWMGTTQSIIAHTIFFVVVFLLVPVLGLDKVLLVLTTAVSLEAIYLSLFIQMTVNRNTESLEDVEEDIEEIQEDVENVEGDIDRIQGDVEDLGEEVEDISDDIERIQDKNTKDTVSPHPVSSMQLLLNIQKQLNTVSSDITMLKKDIHILKQKPR